MDRRIELRVGDAKGYLFDLSLKLVGEYVEPEIINNIMVNCGDSVDCLKYLLGHYPDNYFLDVCAEGNPSNLVVSSMRRIEQYVKERNEYAEIVSRRMSIMDSTLVYSG
jgi:hypothetical protein